MNCHHARQLISPYLDHQLTGREMLALQDHFEVCVSCEREMLSIRQVKRLLRGLREPGLPRGFSEAVALRLEQEQAGQMGLRVLFPPAPKPQRGRRLATALALSCLTVVSLVAPFAPDGREAVRSSSSLFTTGSHVFAAPPSADAVLYGTVLSGHASQRSMLIPVYDLSPLSLSEAAVQPRPDPLMLTEMDTQPAPPSLEVNARGSDVSFGSAQLAVARTR